jgi:hypothetical protein
MNLYDLPSDVLRLIFKNVFDLCLEELQSNFTFVRLHNVKYTRKAIINLLKVTGGVPYPSKKLNRSTMKQILNRRYNDKFLLVKCIYCQSFGWRDTDSPMYKYLRINAICERHLQTKLNKHLSPL